jgi:hypothetical protein
VADAPLVEVHDGFAIVRDDLVEGGTKVRALPALLVGGEEFVYAGPAQGYAQLALAVACAGLGLRATLLVPKRKAYTPMTAAALRHGAKIISVPAGRLSVLQARARAYCAMTGAVLLPFGLADARMVDALADVARTLPAPEEAWVAAGSGTLSLALARAWPSTALNVVAVGRVPVVPEGATSWRASERFDEVASGPLPPVPSALHYDAKVWRFLLEHARPGALWWNVAGEPD